MRGCMPSENVVAGDKRPRTDEKAVVASPSRQTPRTVVDDGDGGSETKGERK